LVGLLITFRLIVKLGDFQCPLCIRCTSKEKLVGDGCIALILQNLVYLQTGSPTRRMTYDDPCKIRPIQPTIRRYTVAHSVRQSRRAAAVLSIQEAVSSDCLLGTLLFGRANRPADMIKPISSKIFGSTTLIPNQRLGDDAATRDQFSGEETIGRDWLFFGRNGGVTMDHAEYHPIRGHSAFEQAKAGLNQGSSCDLRIAGGNLTNRDTP
jgi:hypothetical protein